MTWHNAYLGDYEIKYDDTSGTNPINVNVRDRNKKAYGPIPTTAECNEVLETAGRLLNIDFYYCINMTGAPAFRENIKDCISLFDKCSSLIVAPKLPEAVTNVGEYTYSFEDCSSLLSPPVIPQSAVKITYMFIRDSALRTAASIPKNVEQMIRVYSGCVSIEGEFCIRSTSLSNYGNALADTIKPITIYGDQSVCEAVAATANNGNVSWQPWYDPVPAVTNRGQGSYTTAEDMTRMVRNGCLAVDSYAPGRMVYNRGDIVREDEWTALVEAAQTIDPTVTMSTHYTNLNKIEKAFDDAL